MKSSDLRLDLVRIQEIRGSAFGPDEGELEQRLKATFNAAVTTDLSEIAQGDRIELKLKFIAQINDSEEPSFEIEVAGEFIIEDEHAISELKSEAGAYQAAAQLFPYVRHFSKPLLESLGAANIEFPFYIAGPPATAPKAPKRKKRSVS